MIICRGFKLPFNFVYRYTELYEVGIEINKLVTENFRLYFNIPLRHPPPQPEVSESVEDEVIEELLPPPLDKEELAPSEEELPLEG